MNCKMMDLKDIAKAFGCNVSMLANTMGYTRQGLHTAVNTGEVQKTRMYGSLKHLEAISQLKYEEELMRAKERKQERDKGIEDMAYLFNLCWEPDNI